MASYLPPNETLPIFDTTVFDQETQLDYKTALTQFLTYPTAQGDETLQGITVQGQGNFNNDVNFNYLNSPPHCSIPPTSANDLCNKAYVDSQAPLTAFQLFCNYSQTFTTPTPTTYELLSDTEVFTPTTLPWTISTIGTQYITGFFNLITTLNIGSVIPPGNWTLNCYANVSSINDQLHAGLFYTIIGVSSLGVETVLYTSSSSPLLTVISPSIGLYGMTITVPFTPISAYVDIGIKLYLTSNMAPTTTGNIYFQNTGSYTSLLTSFSVLTPATIVSSNNVWTGTNTFNNQLSMGASGLNTLTIGGTSGNINSSSGTMNIETNNVNAMSINGSQIVSFNNPPSMSGASISNGTIPLLSVVGTACDISTSQTIAGTKTFSTAPVMSGASISSGTIPITSVVGTAMDLTTSQTVNGIKTFSNAPTMSGTGISGGIPITSVVGTAMDLTTSQTVNGTKTFSNAPTMSGTGISSGTIPITSVVGTAMDLTTTQTVNGTKTFSISPMAPTASPGNNTTTIATTAFVTTAVSGSVGTATNVNVVNQTATAGSFNVGILQGVSGALPVGASTGLTYNNTLGTLTCNNFNGTVSTASAIAFTNSTGTIANITDATTIYTAVVNANPYNSIAGTGGQTAIGSLAGNSAQGTGCVAIGISAGNSVQGAGSVAIGNTAGQTSQEPYCVAIGAFAGTTNQQGNSVAVGSAAGQTSQGTGCVAIGPYAGQSSQGDYAVAIGNYAGQGTTSAQGTNAIAIGNNAGTASQTAGSICLNASGIALNPNQEGLFVNPIRSIGSIASATTLEPVFFNTTSKEIVSATPTVIRDTVNAARAVIVSGTIYNSSTTSVLAIGTYLLTFYIQLLCTDVAGNIQFINAGLSTSTTAYTGGTGFYQVLGLTSTPAVVASSVSGSISIVWQNTVSQAYYYNYSAYYNTTVLSLAANYNFIQYTRIA